MQKNTCRLTGVFDIDNRNNYEAKLSVQPESLQLVALVSAIDPIILPIPEQFDNPIVTTPAELAVIEVTQGTVGLPISLKSAACITFVALFVIAMIATLEAASMISLAR